MRLRYEADKPSYADKLGRLQTGWPLTCTKRPQCKLPRRSGGWPWKPPTTLCAGTAAHGYLAGKGILNETTRVTGVASKGVRPECAGYHHKPGGLASCVGKSEHNKTEKISQLAGLSAFTDSCQIAGD